jgi:dolichol-phosphate mannosyltransferase
LPLNGKVEVTQERLAGGQPAPAGQAAESRSAAGSVYVILPTYNEAENLAEVVARVLEHPYSVLIVDDDSPDGTGRLAAQLAAEEPRLSVLQRSGKQGLGSAYAEGFSVALAAGAEILCEMDADLSHDPDELPRLIAAVEDGAQLAIGSRFVPGGAIEGWPRRRRFLSRWGNRYARVMLGVPVKDLTSGFRAFRAEALSRLRADTCRSAGYAFQVEMAWRAHLLDYRITEVPITFRERRRGRSKLDGRIIREAMWLVTRWGMGRLLRRRPEGFTA